MNRRDTLLALLAFGAAPLGVCAQQPGKRFRVGVLQISSEASAKPTNQAFLAGLRDRGYVPGQNLVVDFRYADNNRNLLPGLADELIALKPDVLVGTEITGIVMKAKTASVPIVLLVSSDPVRSGLVRSLGRPGTNVTGMSGQLDLLAAKQIELLIEFLPKMSRLALLGESPIGVRDAGISNLYGNDDPFALALAPILKAKGLTLVVVRARDSESLRKAFAVLKQQRAEGLVVPQNAVIANLHTEIIGEVTRLRMPTIAGYAWFAMSGGLLSYGVSFTETYRYAAKFVDLILKGAKPADLPVEQVSKYELLVNQKTARELGLKIPQSILLRADRVIE